MIRKIFLSGVLLALHFTVFAQQTTVFTEANLDYKRGVDFYERGVYGAAMQEFGKVVTKLRPLNEPEAGLLLTKAELNLAKSAVRLDMPDGEKMMLDFIRKYNPDPISNLALTELADYYFNTKKYDKAIEYYNQIPTYQLSGKDRAGVKFKLGYAYFVQKNFAKAKANFYPILQLPQSEYFAPAYYYYGLCEFFDGNYNEAVTKLRVVENNPRYQPHVPYYLTQIYFAQRRFDELIAYAEPKIDMTGLKNVPEIRQLIGQSYFEKGNYTKAIPHLEYYAGQTGKLREEEFYQLGFTQYKTGNFAQAIKNLEELSRSESKIGQHAMYILGDCYLKTNRKSSARNAFGLASRMNFDPVIRQDALFHYGKLSYELKFDQDALTALQGIPTGSEYYNEAQTLLSELFLNSRDYERALAIIESIPNKTPKIREAYQKVAYYRALQLYQDGRYADAKGYFKKSLEVPVNQEFKALTTFWLGQIAAIDKDYGTSNSQLSQFLTMAKTVNNLPDEASVHMANYVMGYNYLKQKNYTSAEGYFKETVAGIKRNSAFMKSDYVKKTILGDAVLRAGDCLFRRNKYDDAVRFYNEAIDGGYSGYVYAIFQKATIEGLRGKRTEQILAFESIAEQYPNSEYADDALLQLGKIYHEIGRLPEALVPLKKLVTDYKSRSDQICQAYIQLGLISYNQGNLEVAINYYKQVFSNNPSASEATDALKALEIIYINDLGKTDEYVAFMETIPGYNVDDAAKDSINFKAAESQYESGNYDRAVQAYTTYISKYPNGRNRLAAQYHRGDSYFSLKDYSNALKDYEYVVSKGTSRFYVKAVENAALIAYNHEQNFAKAYNYYSLWEGAASSDKDKFEAQLGALRSAYKLKNNSAVLDLANKVANNPNASVEQKANANFYIGKISLDKKDYDNARASFNKVIRAQESSEIAAESRYHIAYIYYLERDLNTALDICQRANRESAQHQYWLAKTIILMSDIYAEKGDLLSARTLLEALLEKYKGDQEIIDTAKAKKAQLDKLSNESSRLNTKPVEKIEFDSGN